jgi:hypothetical protein
MVGGKEEDRPHPSLLPQEKESLFPHLVNLGASRLRLIQWPLIRPVRRRFASAFASLPPSLRYGATRRRDKTARQDGATRRRDKTPGESAVVPAWRLKAALTNSVLLFV